MLNTLNFRDFSFAAVQHRKNKKNVNLERIRSKERRGDNQQSRYRHLYQVRRSNGDVIARVSTRSKWRNANI